MIIILGRNKSGISSWVDGFSLNRKSLQLKEKTSQLLSEAYDDPEELFDRLMEEGRDQEAAWLVEHLDRFTMQGSC